MHVPTIPLNRDPHRTPLCPRFVTLLVMAGTLIPFSARWGRGDTIFQTTPQGTERILRRNTIVVKEDPNSIFYKHFELKERRVVKVRLEKGSFRVRVEKSDAAVREQIVANWKRFGHTAEVTDIDGNSKRLFSLYLDFYPPGGRGSLHNTVPPRTTLPVRFADGGMDEIEFSVIKRIEFQGFRMRIQLNSGASLDCEFRMPTDQPAEARFLGMTDAYPVDSEEVFDFFLPLEKLKEIKLGRERRRRRRR